MHAGKLYPFPNSHSIPAQPRLQLTLGLLSADWPVQIWHFLVMLSRGDHVPLIQNLLHMSGTRVCSYLTFSVPENRHGRFHDEKCQR